MRIAILSYEFPIETGFGGIGTYSLQLARDLVRLGNEVHVIAGAVKPKTEDLLHGDGFRITRARLGGRYRRFFDTLFGRGLKITSVRLENALTMYAQFRRLHTKKRFDIVEMPECGSEGFFINRFIGDVKKCLTFHSPSYCITPYCPIGKTDFAIESRMERAAVRGADCYCSPSSYLAESARSWFGLRKSVAVIPVGLDFSMLDAVPPMDVKSTHRIERGRPVVIVQGRVEMRKGTHLLEEIIPLVARRIPSVLFVVVGRITYPQIQRGIMDRLARDGIPRAVRFMGHVSHAEMVNFMRAADVFLLPSLWENFPGTLLDAMGMGKAIVAAAVGGVPEMIEDRHSGLLAETGNARDFAEKTIEMLDTPDFARRCGAAARSDAMKRFEHMEMAREKLALYLGARAGGGYD